MLRTIFGFQQMFRDAQSSATELNPTFQDGISLIRWCPNHVSDLPKTQEGATDFDKGRVVSI